ncbi:MAG: hypothetical protein JWN92_994 [Candidatus Acidoferrum typicum]|nr:hypothetical protein [Candidatus Acidoferrum typicum]
MCFWCGYQYRGGEYSPESESAHLLQCSEYPQEGKLRIQKPKNTPNVGIIFLVGKTLLIDRTPVSEGEIYGDFRIHERGHDMYWDTLKKTGVVPQDSEYDDYPRGRVAYNTKTKNYSLFLDRCILKNKSVVKEIMSELNLPTRRTKTGTDSHYKCYRCLWRGLQPSVNITMD